MERLRTKPAKIIAGQLFITEGGFDVLADDVNVLCQAQGDSSGYVVIGEEFAFYVINAQPDLASIISQMSDLCDQIILVLDTVYCTAATAAVFSIKPELQLIKPSVEAIKQSLDTFQLK
jgi:hypothetical protein